MASSSLDTSSAKKRLRLGPPDPKETPRKPFGRGKMKSPFPDFGTYMSEKNRKLRNQFDADASASSCSAASGDGDGDGDGDGQRRGIFRGVSIFVDGFTIPSSQELKGFMIKHGGRFENYFSRHRVTHIVCSHLPDSKMRNFRAFSRGLPVVKPAWVLDCVVANKLLSWIPYQLEELVNETGKQQKLSAFFTPKRMSASNDAQKLVDPHLNFADESLEEPEHLLLHVEGKFLESRAQGNEESACPELKKSFEGSSVDTTFIEQEDEHSVVAEFIPDRPSSMVDSRFTDNNNCSESVDTEYRGISNQPHSTIGDPNFVENYFKNSRLHFIGTWRSRYCKRFSNMSSGGKCIKTDDGPLSTTRKASIIHIDMDCFFVSVVIRNYPKLHDQPVAVCHSDSPKGTAEISSANYPARDAGVRAGMFVRDAKARCPHLAIVPYDFEAYEEVADQFYSILHNHCDNVQALSCDEAFLDVTNCGNNDPEHLALIIRKEIAETTRCTASAGIAGNLLLARLATRTAKPNGQCFIPSEEVDNYLKDLPVEALPGIGHALGEKLKSRQIHTCGQLRLISQEALHKDFGSKTGDMLWNFCRGVDNRMVEVVQETKSVGAEVNWGVRFNDNIECEHFLMNLCKEVSLRLQGCGVEGRTITLKVKKRRKGAQEPAKFMGCGDCENMSRSMTLLVATDDVTLLQRITKQIFASFCVDVKEVRGVGLQISRLEHAELSKQGRGRNTLHSWLASSVKSKEQHKESAPPFDPSNHGGTALLEEGKKPLYLNCRIQQNQETYSPIMDANGSSSRSHIIPCSARSHENTTSTLPPLCHLDVDVIRNLPLEIVSEMNDMYNGRLFDLMMKHDKGDQEITKFGNISAPEARETILSSARRSSTEDMTGGLIDFVELYSAGGSESKSICSAGLSVPDLPMEAEAENGKQSPVACNISKGKLSNELSFSGKPETRFATCADRSDLMADFTKENIANVQTVEVKDDAFESHPAQGVWSCSATATSYSHGELPNSVGSQQSSKIHLWLGNPPKWVEKFKSSSCLILNVIAELYTKNGESTTFSVILQYLLSFCHLNFDSNNEEWGEALSSLYELIMQYIELMIQSDVEELYVCFRLLKRISSASKFFLQVYNILLPPLQASVSENYGGELQLWPDPNSCVDPN